MLAVDATDPEYGVNCDTCRCRNGLSDRPWRIPDLKIESRRCPRQLVTPFSWYALQFYGYFDQGHLPSEGGVADQPYKLMQAFSVIAARRARNAQQKAKRGKKTPR